jgi:hypothetical protein
MQVVLIDFLPGLLGKLKLLVFYKAFKFLRWGSGGGTKCLDEYYNYGGMVSEFLSTYWHSLTSSSYDG